MARRRLGVVLLVPPPWDAEVDGLRRASGDGSLGRIPAHLTLVPPVNVREDDLTAALAVLRRAAAATTPFTLHLGPAATFLPDNPVLYLAVGGELDALRALRDAVFIPPLARPLTWPFVPHVTLAEESAPARLAAAVTAMGDYGVDVELNRLHLLEEARRSDGARAWSPIADAVFEPPAVVGRGGLPVELTVSELLDPEAAAVLAAVAPRSAGPPPLTVVTARRDDAVVGVACGRRSGDELVLDQVAVVPEARRQGIAHHLLGRFAALQRDSD